MRRRKRRRRRTRRRTRRRMRRSRRRRRRRDSNPKSQQSTGFRPTTFRQHRDRFDYNYSSSKAFSSSRVILNLQSLKFI
jgi:hypothetical protein